MMFKDTTRIGMPFAKDPHVIYFQEKYLMYYSVPPFKDNIKSGWGIGIASSSDLVNWVKVGEITPALGLEYEKNGLCAPCALVHDNEVHLFYQTYGNGVKDAICHATSKDGINFERNPTNPILSPDGDWNCGRAIDAEVCKFKGKYYLYFATRDKDFKVQFQGVAVASEKTNFNREDWCLVDAPILFPEFTWEENCIEAASVVEKYGKLFMFYAGAYNNAPQQIGVAISEDGINWKKIFDKPFLSNGKPGEWNASESGHPHIFEDINGRTYLFYQGNNDNGRTWYITNQEVFWENGTPFLSH